MSDILRLSLPLTAWLAAFSAVYGLQALTCSPRWAEAGLGPPEARMALLLAAALAVGVQAGLLLWLRRGPGGSAWVGGVSLTLAIASLVAAAWTLLPVAVTSACL